VHLIASVCGDLRQLAVRSNGPVLFWQDAERLRGSRPTRATSGSVPHPENRPQDRNGPQRSRSVTTSPNPYNFSRTGRKIDAGSVPSRQDQHPRRPQANVSQRPRPRRSNPALPDDDFNEAIRIAQAEYDQHQPNVVVGSSRGGAVAMNIESGDTPLVVLCPAWKKWGSATTVKPNTTILHSRDVVPFANSLELIKNSGLPVSALIEIGRSPAGRS
jgi:hypothetical protein